VTIIRVKAQSPDDLTSWESYRLLVARPGMDGEPDHELLAMLHSYTRHPDYPIYMVHGQLKLSPVDELWLSPLLLFSGSIAFSDLEAGEFGLGAIWPQFPKVTTVTD